MNNNLANAKKAKNDEFYTRLEDIEKELCHYEQHFRDKVIYCNCDDAQRSMFWKYFRDNYERLGIKRLIATGLNAAYYELDEDGMSVKELKGNGDFRSEECIEILKEADVVVSNPPFSLFREYAAQLMQYGKKFVIVGPVNAITYKNIFPHIKDNEISLGINQVRGFMKPDGTFDKSVENCRWFTNLDTNKRHHIYECYSRYNETDYQKYDNYDAINVNKVCDIPCDYTGVMGVPITFLDKHCPEQFDIIKFRKGNDEKDLCINGKCPYFRIIIRWKPEAMPHIYDDGVILYE